MSQMSGLLWKDWKRSKSTAWMMAALYFIILLFLPFLFQKTVAKGQILFDVMLGVNAFFAFLSMLFPSIGLIVLLEKEMRRPDLWLHSPASMYKLVGSKLLFVSLSGIGGMVIPAIVMMIGYLVTEATVPFMELVRFCLPVFLSFLAAAVSTASITLFLWVIYRLLKGMIGKAAGPIMVFASIALTWLFGYFVMTPFYKKYIEIGPINLHSLGGSENTDILSLQAGTFFYTGELLFNIILTVLPFILAVKLIDKKVRL